MCPGSRFSALIAVVLAASLAGDAGADPCFLVKDLNPSVSWGTYSGHSDFVRWGSSLYFFSRQQSLEPQLWRTDGTPGGTELITKLPASSGSTGPSALTAADTQLFFSAWDAQGGLELWRSDGTTAGTYRVKDICQGVCDSTPRYLTSVGNGVVVFQARTQSGGAELWRSDGTDAGTYSPKLIGGGTGSNAYAFTRLGDGAYFIADDHVHGYSLWRTDGTWAGTALVKAAVATIASDRHVGVALDRLLVFTGGDASGAITLWRSDGTDTGTYLLNATLDPVSLTGVAHTVFFAGYDASHGRELWKTDGTPGGTVLVKDIVAGTSAGNPIELAAYGDVLLFQANGASTQLWRSDGTGAGTTLVSSVPVAPADITEMGGIAYFAATGTTSYASLWRTDGTAGGTAVVATIAAAGGSAAGLAALDAHVVFWASDSVHAFEPWSTDGTASGTVQLADTSHLGDSGDPQELVAIGDTVLFSAAETTSGTRELFVSDGTAAGTRSFSFAVAGSAPQQLTAHAGRVFYNGGHQSLGRELFVTDGTVAGTSLVADVDPGIDSCDPTWLTDTPWALLFTGYASPGSQGLYQTDGTTAGTHRFGGPGSYGPRALLGDRLIYAYPTTTQGTELWTTAGETPWQLRDLAPGVESGNPTGLTRMGDRMYFAANDGVNGIELWATDGTAAGTVLVKDIYPGAGSSSPSSLAAGDGILYFAANDGVHGSELWATDGTTAGTQLVRDINPSGSTGSAPTGTVVIGRKAFFSADDGAHSREPWTSDGTAAGTIMLKDIETTQGSSNPTGFTAFPSMGIALFGATSSTIGTELWLSDGTPAGTTLVEDIFPGVGSSAPGRFTLAGPLVFFAASDRDHGRELWAVPRAILDRTGPLISFIVSGTLGDHGWYRSDVTVTWSVDDPDSPVTSTSGCDALTVTADTAGLVITCTATSWGGTTARTVTIARDATAPVPACPTDTTVEAESASGATAGFSVTATDNFDPAPVVSAVPPSGDRFPLGTTHVTVTARDEAGNQGACGFDLTVADTTPPVVTCPTDIAVPAASAAGATVTYSPATAGDAVDPVPVVDYDVSSGALFPVGTTTVTATARDAAGNIATCTFHVIVSPWTAPQDGGVDAAAQDAPAQDAPAQDAQAQDVPAQDAPAQDAQAQDAQAQDVPAQDAPAQDAQAQDAQAQDAGDAATVADGPGGNDAEPASDGPGAPDGAQGQADGPDIGAHSSGCGCATSGTDPAGAGLVLVLGLMVLRRRRTARHRTAVRSAHRLGCSSGQGARA